MPEVNFAWNWLDDGGNMGVPALNSSIGLGPQQAQAGSSQGLWNYSLVQPVTIVGGLGSLRPIITVTEDPKEKPITSLDVIQKPGLRMIEI